MYFKQLCGLIPTQIPELIFKVYFGSFSLHERDNLEKIDTQVNDWLVSKSTISVQVQWQD